MFIGVWKLVYNAFLGCNAALVLELRVPITLLPKREVYSVQRCLTHFCLWFQMDSLLIHCYYCTHTNPKLNNIIKHLCQYHRNDVMKIKQHVLCHETTKLELQTTIFPFIPADLKEYQYIEYNKASNKVRHHF